MEFKIEKNVPFATSKWPSMYPFEKMDIGDSFSAPAGKHHAVRCAASAYGRRHKKKFSVRKHGPDCRVWRLA